MNYYFKIDITEHDDNPFAYFALKDYDKGKRAPLVNRHFPLDLISEQEPKLLELVKDEIDHAYYEEKKSSIVNMISEEGVVLGEMSKDDVEYLKNLAIDICINEKYDELLAPPSVDQQVEDFIKEFFEPESDVKDIEDIDGDTPLDQKDFLAEFFAELEEENEKEN